MRGNWRQLGWTIFFLIFAFAAIAALSGPEGQVQHFFAANPGLNGLICLILLAGLLFALGQFFMLNRAAAWSRRTGSSIGSKTGKYKAPPPLLLSLDPYLNPEIGDAKLDSDEVQLVADSVLGRLTAARDVLRYMMGLLVFLGLLGTFWGLLQTLTALADLIAGLDVAAEDVGPVFASLITGLERPLGGMGTAFSSSLFGLGGSLILGFADLQLGAAHNHFAHQLEVWLQRLRHHRKTP